MTFRVNLEAARNPTYTVNTPAAAKLVQRIIYGTTSWPHHLDVLWMGKHLALVKQKVSLVRTSVVVIDDPRAAFGSSARDTLRALSKGDHWQFAAAALGTEAYWRGECSFAIEHDGRLAPKLLANWIERLKAADERFEHMATTLRNAAKVEERAAAAKLAADRAAAKRHAEDAIEVWPARRCVEAKIVTPRIDIDTWARVEVRAAGSDRVMTALFGPAGLSSVELSGSATMSGAEANSILSIFSAAIKLTGGN